MAGTEVSEALRNAVRERAKGRCEYCLTSEAFSGVRCQIDHILPRSRGRAMIAALRLNDPLIVGARALWAGLGAHPPQDE